jgi:hypothetical protein
VLRPFRFLTIEKYHKLTRAERKHYVAGVTEELMRRRNGLHDIIETRGAVTAFAHDVTKFTQQVTQLRERAESLHRAMLRVSAQL